MYQASVPPMLQMFASMTAILDKAIKHCEARKIDPDKLLTYRLAFDMNPLPNQIQAISDQAKGCVARLAGIDIPAMPDNEASIDDLKARIAKTVEFLKSIKPEQINGTEDKEIVLKLGPAGPNQFEIKFTGSQYLLHFVMPNFYFHHSTAYDILRHAGVEIGKRDFMGSI
jgi:hypothetical protein